MNQDEEKICYFASENGACRCLDKGCYGWQEKCTFKKTAKEFTTERDNAVSICRKKGLCYDCRYYSTPCKLSSE